MEEFRNYLLIGLGLLLVAGGCIWYMASGKQGITQKEHNYQIEQKAHTAANDYYVLGKDPMIFNAKAFKMRVKAKEYEELVEGSTYYIKYRILKSNKEEKEWEYELTKIVEEKKF